jgi:hypothetical protein
LEVEGAFRVGMAGLNIFEDDTPFIFPFLVVEG